MMENKEALLAAFSLLDQTRMTVRDVRVLHAMRENPGMNGSDLREYLGLAFHSMVKNNIGKLIKAGLAYDTRDIEQQAIPRSCYITDRGKAFLEGIGI